MEKRESKTLREIYEEKYYENGNLTDNLILLAEQKGYLECLKQFQSDEWIRRELSAVMIQGLILAVTGEGLD